MSNIRSNIIKLSTEKTLYVQPIDAQKLYINTSNVSFITIEKKDNDIISVSLEDKYIIKIKDKFKINVGKIDSLYNVDRILIDKNKDSIVLFHTLPTKTTTFILPCLEKTKKFLSFEYYFINAYLDKENENRLLLHYRFTGTDVYKNFELKIMGEDSFIRHVDVDNYTVIYIFAIKDIYIQDIKFFKEGKYSKFSDTLKRNIQSFYKYDKFEKDSVMNVIEKNEELRKFMEKDLRISISKDSELASKPNLNFEFFNYN